MGNFFKAISSTNINQTELSSINQKCNETASSSTSGINITAIDSHIGDIDISAQLTVGSMECVFSAVSQQAIEDSVANTAISEIASLPFQANVNSQDVENTTNIASFQQSIIDQSCIQNATASVQGVTFTFIDSSTGNIKVAAVNQISSFSCNLQASSYQTAAASVKNYTEGKISNGCCLFNLGMIIPVILGFVGLYAMSKYMNKKDQDKGPRSGSGEQQPETTADQLLKLGQGIADLNSGAPPPAPPKLSRM